MAPWPPANQIGSKLGTRTEDGKWHPTPGRTRALGGSRRGGGKGPLRRGQTRTRRGRQLCPTSGVGDGGAARMTHAHGGNRMSCARPPLPPTHSTHEWTTPACPSPSSQGRARSHVTVYDAAPVTSTPRGARQRWRCGTSHEYISTSCARLTWTRCGTLLFTHVRTLMHHRVLARARVGALAGGTEGMRTRVDSIKMKIRRNVHAFMQTEETQNEPPPSPIPHPIHDLCYCIR